MWPRRASVVHKRTQECGLRGGLPAALCDLVWPVAGAAGAADWLGQCCQGLAAAVAACVRLCVCVCVRVCVCERGGGFFR